MLEGKINFVEYREMNTQYDKTQAQLDKTKAQSDKTPCGERTIQKIH